MSHERKETNRQYRVRKVKGREMMESEERYVVGERKTVVTRFQAKV